MTFYELNPSDQIESVGGGWDAFARDNDGADAMAHKVLGRRLWDFVDGVSTAIYLHAILNRCRHERQSFQTSYRCDSLDEARLFWMHVTPQNGRLRVDHRLVWNTALQQSRKVIVLADFRSANRCSICCSYRVGNKWFDPLLQPDLIHFPRGNVLCDRCRDYSVGYLENLNNGTAPIPFG